VQGGRQAQGLQSNLRASMGQLVVARHCCVTVCVATTRADACGNRCDRSCRGRAYLAARAAGRAAITSPRPPDFDHGATSVVTKTTCIHTRHGSGTGTTSCMVLTCRASTAGPSSRPAGIAHCRVQHMHGLHIDPSRHWYHEGDLRLLAATHKATISMSLLHTPATFGGR
jgi:hypothetical protein